MNILVRYENVPHFCFKCGRIGHAAAKCKADIPDELGVRFSEELRASPIKRAREKTVRLGKAKAAKPLSFAGPQADWATTPVQATKTADASSGGATRKEEMMGEAKPKEDAQEEQDVIAKENTSSAQEKHIPQVISNELVNGISDMKVADKRAIPVDNVSDMRQRVSIGTNMSSEEDTSDSINQSVDEGKMTSIDRFHAKKFGTKTTNAGRAALKIAGTGREIETGKKLQLSPNIEGAIHNLVVQGLNVLANVKTEATEEAMEEKMEMSPAKKMKAVPSKSVPKNLTGAPREPRQEQ